MNLYGGTSGFSYKEWKGSFYPEDLTAKQMLRYYGERFRTVEINNTFYRMPKPSVLEAWAGDVPPGFRFVLKAPQQITHRQRLKDSAASVAFLLEACSALKERLGPLLFQLPPNLKKDLPRLRDFLALLPAPLRAAFEFRHESWFEEDVLALLREYRAVLCVAETDDNLRVPCVGTADWGYLRLRRADYGDTELRAWVERVRDQDWRDAFVFFKHEEAGRGPELARRYLELAG